MISVLLLVQLLRMHTVWGQEGITSVPAGEGSIVVAKLKNSFFGVRHFLSPISCRHPRRSRSLGQRSQPQVLTKAEPVVRGVRQDSGEAPQELVADGGCAERAVPDPAHRRAGVGVRRGDERREPAVQHRARHQPGRHEERGLQ